MTVERSSTTRHFRQLLALNARRLSGMLRRPTPAFIMGVALPVVVILSALWMLGRTGVPIAIGPAGGLTLGLLISGTLAFAAYGALFGGGDALFLKRLGASPQAIFLERTSRLAGIAAAVVLGSLLPYATAGQPVGPPFAVGVVSASVATGTAALAYAWAARATAGGGPGGMMSAGIRQWDPALARAAPLIYAPLLPFLAGAFAGAGTGALQSAAWPLGALAVLFAIAAGGLAAFIFRHAAGRFLPQVSEMAYTPPPEKQGERFRVGRGISALLPRRAAAVWVRDATVGGRRFAWAARVTWPVAVVSIIALARWGDANGTRTWVVTAVGLALVIQAGAVVGLGLLERGRTRWIDRSTGVGWWERWLGRWVWSWGLSLWLLVPVGLAWAWWSGVDGAWAWPLAGMFTAAIATTVSLLNSERA